MIQRYRVRATWTTSALVLSASLGLTACARDGASGPAAAASDAGVTSEGGQMPVSDTEQAASTSNASVGNSGSTSATSASSSTTTDPAASSGEMRAAQCGDWACFPMPNPEADPARPADYDTSDADVVFDRVTGLLWQKAAPPEQVKADVVETACDEVTLSGFSDWRLPTLMELVSLVDHASDAAAGTLKTADAFADSGPYDFWSSTLVVESNGRWLASLSAGYVDAPSAAANARVRCVRTHEVRATGSEHYTASGTGENGTVLDHWTGLTWHAQATTSEYSFAEAAVYCAGSTLGGGGWRVPSARELITLVDRSSEQALKIDDAFFSGTQRNTWTSSPSRLLNASAWFVDFQLARLDDLMITGGDLVDQKFSVRCVR